MKHAAPLKSKDITVAVIGIPKTIALVSKEISSDTNGIPAVVWVHSKDFWLHLSRAVPRFLFSFTFWGVLISKLFITIVALGF